MADDRDHKMLFDGFLLDVNSIRLEGTHRCVCFVFCGTFVQVWAGCAGVWTGAGRGFQAGLGRVSTPSGYTKKTCNASLFKYCWFIV